MVKYIYILCFCFIPKIGLAQNKYFIGTHVNFHCYYYKKDTSFKIKSYSVTQYIPNYIQLKSFQSKNLPIDTGCCFKIRATNEFSTLQCSRAGNSAAYTLWNEDTSIRINVANLRVYRFISLICFFNAKLDYKDYNYMSEVFGEKSSISISPDIISYSVIKSVADSLKFIEIMILDKKLQRPVEVIEFAAVNDNIFITGRQTFIYRNRHKCRKV